MMLKFTKMHGLGNDFVILDGIRSPIALDRDQARAIADRRRGVGCDQVLLLQPASGKDADVDCRIFNSDGSDAQQCGNGARCISMYLHRGECLGGGTIRIRYPGGIIEGKVEDNEQVTVNMGVPRFEPDDIGLRVSARADEYEATLPAGSIRFAALSMGNPHAVIITADVDRAPVEQSGAALQTDGRFADGVNVEFMQIIDRGHIRLRVYERGAGETLACGSGACAAVVAGRMQGRLDNEVDVQLKGGHLRVSWDGEGHPVWMTGPGTHVFDGTIDL